MIHITWETVFSFSVYLLGMLIIGIYFYRKTKNLSDYILGGRNLNYYVASLSAQASDMSGWLLLGLPGYAYLNGMEAGWIAIGLCLGTYLNWKFIAKRLREFTLAAGNAITLPVYFENRFADQTRILRITSACFILIFFLLYTASGFVAGAKLFHSVFGLPYVWALSVGVLVIISYTFLGGFMAVSWTDLIQGMLMFIAILTIPLIGITAIGGISQTFEAIRLNNPHLLSFFTAVNGRPLSWITIISLLAWGLGYFGQPHILVRFMAIRSADEISKARKIAMIWVILSLGAALMIGLIGIILLQSQPLIGKISAETVFILLIKQLTHPLLGGFLLAAILAAIMSTADSQLLVTSSAISEDFYQSLLKKKATDKKLVWIGRLSVMAVAMAAYVIALNPESSVLDLVAYAWAGFGATFGPVIILSLFWKRMTRSGALAGIIVGGITVLIWKNITGGIFELYEIVPGFIFSSLAIIGFSLADKVTSQKMIDLFHSFKNSQP